MLYSTQDPPGNGYVTTSRSIWNMSVARRVTSNVLALTVGCFGGGYLHFYLLRLLSENAGWNHYSWNVPEEHSILVKVLLEDFVFGALLALVAGILIIWRGFKVPYSALFGLGASIMGLQILGVMLCWEGC